MDDSPIPEPPGFARAPGPLVPPSPWARPASDPASEAAAAPAPATPLALAAPLPPDVVRPRGISVFAALIIALAALAVGLFLGSASTENINRLNFLKSSAKIEAFDEAVVEGIYDAAIPSVVTVESRRSNTPGARFVETGQGSGFFIDAEGGILTNLHVVQGSSVAVITLHDGRELEGAVIATDAQHDLALVRVDPKAVAGIRPLVLADSSKVKPGQLAVALGTPLGLKDSITVGVVSGVGRRLQTSQRRPLGDMIQTDAAIFPGSSGGPLMNSRGEVIGVNTAASTESSENLGFAISSNTARTVSEKLVQGTSSRRPWIGVSLATIDSGVVAAGRLSVTQGVYIIRVVQGSPAAKANLKGGGDADGNPLPGGDVITSVDGVRMATVEQVVDYVNSRQPGDRIRLSIVRGAERLRVDILLEERPEGNP